MGELQVRIIGERDCCCSLLWTPERCSDTPCLHKGHHDAMCNYWRVWEQDDPQGWRRYQLYTAAQA